MGSLLDEIGAAQSGPGKRSAYGGSRSKKRAPKGATAAYRTAKTRGRTGKPARAARVRGSKSVTRS